MALARGVVQRDGSAFVWLAGGNFLPVYRSPHYRLVSTSNRLGGGVECPRYLPHELRPCCSKSCFPQDSYPVIAAHQSGALPPLCGFSGLRSGRASSCFTTNSCALLTSHEKHCYKIRRIINTHYRIRYMILKAKKTLYLKDRNTQERIWSNIL